jgi:hypothetical protein
MYNLNYAQTALVEQSWRENICGGTRTKKVEYHCARAHSVCLSGWWPKANIELTKQWYSNLKGFMASNFKVMEWHGEFKETIVAYFEMFIENFPARD